MSAVAALATQGGPRLIAVAIAFVGGLRFIKWAAVFVCERWDRHAASTVAREAEVNKRFNARLKHVELELGRYQRATMVLVNAMAKRDPANPALSIVAEILAGSTPITDPDPELDALLARAGDALDQSNRGEQ